MFRFSIRDVLWSMVLVATVLAWWAEKSQRDREWKTVNRYETMTQQNGGPFYIYHHEHREKKGSRLDAYMRPIPGN